MAAADTYVEAGQSILTIAADDLWGLQLEVPATETLYFEEPHKLQITDDADRPLGIREIAYGTHEHPGGVTVIIYVDDAVVDRRRQARVSYESVDEVLLVPWTAVASDDEAQWVAVVDAHSGGVSRRAVELGRAHERGIEVLAGLEEGEWVVRYEPRNLQDGQQVEAQQRDDHRRRP